MTIRNFSNFILSQLLLMLYLLAITVPAFAQDRPQIEQRYLQEMQKLSENPVVSRAYSYIEDIEAKTVKDLIMLTEIPAPPFKEEKRAQKFAALLKEAGADSVWIDGKGNVLALRKGTGGKQVVALDAHLDTVFPEGTDVTVKAKGDTLLAPGIGDDTRGLMVILTVLRAMEQEQVETKSDVLFVGTVGEEGLGDLRGVKYLFGENGPAIDFWISVDGGTLNRIVNKGLGSHRYRVTFKGPGGHSWGAFGYANPAHALGRAVYYFSREADTFTQQGPRTSYNVGRIGGGTSVNSIPFESWMEVDMRSVSSASLNGIDKIFHQAVQKGLGEENSVRRDGPALTVDVKMIGDRPSGEIAESNALVQRAMAATAYFGGKPRLARSSTNSNTPIAKGIPAVTIGRGGAGGGGHSLREWWLNKDGHLAIQRALLLVVSQAGLAD